MVTVSILANTVRPSDDRRLDDTAFGAGTLSWQDLVHSWKAGPGEVMTMENKQRIPAALIEGALALVKENILYRFNLCMGTCRLQIVR